MLTQRENATKLTVNYNYVAMSMTYDLAVFSTREEVEHVLRFASPSSGIRRTGLRIIGYPEGRFAVAQQAEGTIYEDALSYSVPLDRPIVGGFAGSPRGIATERAWPGIRPGPFVWCANRQSPDTRTLNTISV